jgi:hypothetical protein
MADQLLSIDDSTLTAIADAIRSKGGTTAQLSFPDGMVSALQAIETEATVTPKITPQQVTLTPSNTSFPIEAGFHDGTGTVKIETETGSANPTSTEQTYYPSAGKFFSSFWVDGIGSGTQLVTGAKTFTGTSDNFVVDGLSFTPIGVLLFSVPDPKLREYVDEYTSAIDVPNFSPNANATGCNNASGSSYGIYSVNVSYSQGSVNISRVGAQRFMHTYFYIVFGR